MDVLPQAASVLFSPAVLAAFGPSVPMVAFFAWMLVSYFRGREERRAAMMEQAQKSLREDTRDLFEHQAALLDSERALRVALEAKVHSLDELVLRQRKAIFDYYIIARENAHAANNAQQALMAAGVKKPEELTPPTWPDVPKAD